MKYIGSCQHDIDEEWYNSDESSYMMLDEPTGACVNVTTCKACKDDNVDAGKVIDPMDIPDEEFENPFADNPLPDVIASFDSEGVPTYTEITEDHIMSLDDLDGLLN